nr:EOG090X0H59 [Lepidurus arcticus]
MKSPSIVLVWCLLDIVMGDVCPNGMFWWPQGGICHSWLNCEDMTDLKVGELVGSGAVKAIFKAEWREYVLAYVELLNDEFEADFLHGLRILKSLQISDLVGAGGYDSFESDEEGAEKRHTRKDLAIKLKQKSESGPRAKEVFAEEERKEEFRRARSSILSLNAYDRHKRLVNDYILSNPGDTKLLQRDTTRDRRDIDVIRENHQFLWDESSSAETWESRLAKKYYDRLFKEYCICDLSRFKENKVAMRWRIEKEVVEGKGQFLCGDRQCAEREDLRTWEVNFGYVERGEKKNALIKLRLCPDCSYKLNYHHKKKEVTKKKRKHSKQKKLKKRARKERVSSSSPSEERTEEKLAVDTVDTEKAEEKKSASIWKETSQAVEEKTREEEFDEYLQDLFL